MKIALKSTDPIEARRVKEKEYSQLTGAILDSQYFAFFCLGHELLFTHQNNIIVNFVCMS